MTHLCRCWVLAVAVVAVSAIPAEAALMTYSLDGGTSTISGALNGTAFSDKTFSLTMSGDSGGFQYESFPVGPYQFEVWHLAGTVTMTINDLGSFEFVSPSDMFVGSFVTRLGGSVVETRIGFGSSPSGGSGVEQSRLYTAADFQTSFSVTGQNHFVLQSYSTNAGVLDVSSEVQGTGTFTASAAPEPPTVTLVALAVGLIGIYCRQLRA